jgi:hypothetical protein
VAGIAAGGRTPERVQASIYALDVVKGYFLSRGRELKVGDPAKVLERMLDYINAKLHQQSRSKGREFLTDLNLFACTEDRLCVVGTGGAAVFLSHQGKAKKVLGDEAASDLLGRGKGVHFSRLDSPVWAGDLIIMVSPALAEVFGNREISLVVQKAGDPDKAALLINALATRKQLEGDLVSLFWEVPVLEKSEKSVFIPEPIEIAASETQPQAAPEPPVAAPEPPLAVAEPLVSEHHEAEDLEALPEPVVATGVLGEEENWLMDVQEIVNPVKAEEPAEETAGEAGEEEPAVEDEATAIKKRWLKRFGRNRINLIP